MSLILDVRIFEKVVDRGKSDNVAVKSLNLAVVGEYFVDQVKVVEIVEEGIVVLERFGSVPVTVISPAFVEAS